MRVFEVELVFATDFPLSQKIGMAFWEAGDRFGSVAATTYKWTVKVNSSNVVGALQTAVGATERILGQQGWLITGSSIQMIENE